MQDLDLIAKYFKDGNTIEILGERTLIRLEKSLRNFASISSHKEPNNKATKKLVIEYISNDKIRDIIEQFIKEHLKDYITETATIYAGMIGKEFSNIKVKNIKSRWGSCSHKKNLNFSIYLFFNPKESIDYVIAHEVCHLKEMNHSKNFWSLVESLRPNYKHERKNLKMPKENIQTKAKTNQQTKKKSTTNIFSWRFLKSVGR